MINGIVLKNFRAFKEQEFKFKKLNIFIGKNNSGKSSALSAINVIAQTLRDQDLDGTPLVLNGQFDNLGTYIDVVNGNHPNRKIGIDITIDNYTIKTEFKYRTIRREIDLTNFELLDETKSIVKYAQRKDAYDLTIYGDSFEKLFPNTIKRKPRFRNFWPVRLSAMTQTASMDDRQSTQYKKLRDAERILFRARIRLDNHFNHFDAISPFRDRPQRTYLYSGESAKNIGVSGSNMATMISSDAAKRGSQSRNLIDQISSWFEYTGIAKGLSVVSLTPRHFEICLISNDGSKHNICDVGFGCSQVLPVLAAGLNLFGARIGHTDSNVFVVQEPEIHLHPDAQAAMGSYFVSLARQNGQVFIETHSDNLVLRVARHVALGDIAPEDVAIFYVNDSGDDRVTAISVTETGGFTPDWPNGFFPQRQAESLMLARASAIRREKPLLVQTSFQYPKAT